MTTAESVVEIGVKRLRWRLQEFLNANGSEQPISAADRLLDLLVDELLSQPPGTAANQYGNELRRQTHAS